MTRVYIPARGRIAVLAVLAVALLTGVLALRSRPADAATPIHQNSQGQTATFEQYGLSNDGCLSTYAYVSVTASKSVSNTAGGPADVTNQMLLTGWATTYNNCTGAGRETDWYNVPLTPNQFRMDNALNKAVLSGTIPANYGYGCDASGCDYNNPGTGTFNITWQRTGDQLVTPSHGTSHAAGSTTANMEFSGLAYNAQANGSIVLTGVGGAAITVTSTNDGNNSQDGGYLSNNMSVRILVARQAPVITIPAGHTLTIGNVSLGCYDPLTFGYQLDGGSNITVGGGRCYSAANAATVGPFAQDTTIRIWMTDTSAHNCSGYPVSYTYYSDGSHALVTGDGPYQVDIMDSGVGCSVPADQPRLPTWPGTGNLTLTLTISP